MLSYSVNDRKLSISLLGSKRNKAMKLVFTILSIIFMSSCSDGIECEEDASFYKNFDRSDPSYSKHKQYITCTDADGNKI